MVLHGSPADRLVEKKRPIREYEALGDICEGWVSMTPERGERGRERGGGCRAFPYSVCLA